MALDRTLWGNHGNTDFGDSPPASTLCVLRGLANPHFLLEVEAIAVVEADLAPFSAGKQSSL